MVQGVQCQGTSKVPQLSQVTQVSDTPQLCMEDVVLLPQDQTLISADGEPCRLMQSTCGCCKKGAETSY